MGQSIAHQLFLLIAVMTISNRERARFEAVDESIGTSIKSWRSLRLCWQMDRRSGDRIFQA
jgi:hypothetical protein